MPNAKSFEMPLLIWWWKWASLQSRERVLVRCCGDSPSADYTLANCVLANWCSTRQTQTSGLLISCIRQIVAQWNDTTFGHYIEPVLDFINIWVGNVAILKTGWTRYLIWIQSKTALWTCLITKRIKKVIMVIAHLCSWSATRVPCLVLSTPHASDVMRHDKSNRNR